jgi:hypothetical protein
MIRQHSVKVRAVHVRMMRFVLPNRNDRHLRIHNLHYQLLSGYVHGRHDGYWYYLRLYSRPSIDQCCLGIDHVDLTWAIVLATRNLEVSRDLSLYFHTPFRHYVQICRQMSSAR